MIENPDPMDQLFDVIEEENPIKELIKSLFDAENIELKSEIANPSALATLKVLGEECGNVGFFGFNRLIDSIIDKRLLYYVSHKRKGREEFVESLKATSHALIPDPNPIGKEE